MEDIDVPVRPGGGRLAVAHRVGRWGGFDVNPRMVGWVGTRRREYRRRE
jgi:hypothetical protein